MTYISLSGHNGWVTSMQVGEVAESDGSTKEFLISGGRDKSLIIWDIQEKNDTDVDKEWGAPRKVLKGKNRWRIIVGRSLSLHQRPVSFSGQQILPYSFMGQHH